MQAGAILKSFAMRKTILFFTGLFFLLNAFGQHLPAPSRLRCDLLLHTDQVSSHGMNLTIPLSDAIKQPANYQFAKICSAKPWLSWEVDTSIRSISAVSILLASSADKLKEGRADCWDLRKLQSNSTAIRYNGKPLVPGKQYYWKLAVWNEDGIRSAYSDMASFYYNGRTATDSISHYPLSADIQAPKVIYQNGDGSFLADFGKDGFARLTLQIESAADDSAYVEVGELLEGPGRIAPTKGNIRYMKLGLALQRGNHSYQLQWPVNEKRNSRNPILMPAYIGEVYPFRYVQLSALGKYIRSVKMERALVHYPFDDMASSFESDNDILNQVWELCRYTMKASSFTGFYVDGDRERLPYEADALINQLSHYASDAEYSMARRSMAYLLYHPTWPTEWSLQNILLAWNDYLYTGDDSYLNRYYQELQRKILLPLAGDNGLISTRTGKQSEKFLHGIHIYKVFDGKYGLKDNVDWPQRGDYIGNEKEYGGETDGFEYNDYNAVINSFYYADLLMMQKIANVLGRKEDVPFYERKASQVYNSFQQVFYDAATGLYKDGDSTRHSSLHANMFPLLFGLVPAERKPTVLQFIKSRRMACSVYGAQFLLQGLYDAGEAAYALSLMDATTQRSWYNMIRFGSTITMEAWDKLYKPNLDLNHAWGSAPANIIVRKLAGIEPLEPGFDKFRIRPAWGGIKEAHIKTSCLKGVIAINWQANDQSASMELLIPGASIAEVYMPVIEGNQQLYIDGRPVKQRATGGYYSCGDLKAGRHLIVLQ